MNRCVNCFNIVTTEVANYSLKKHNIILCYKCQRIDKR